MRARNDWNHERYRTRDRLIEYDSTILPLTPHTGGMSITDIYPWETQSLTFLSSQLFAIAKNNGFVGTKEEFLEKFGSAHGSIIMGTISTFPIKGKEDAIYIDTDTNILYYFKQIDESLLDEIPEAIVVDIQDQIASIYIPIRALPIDGLIFNSGGAADFIG